MYILPAEVLHSDMYVCITLHISVHSFNVCIAVIVIVQCGCILD